MMKKVLSTATVAVSLVGGSAMAAPQALAVGNDTGTSTLNGNGATSSFGNSATQGHMSPQLTAVQGTLNKLCLGVPIEDINVINLVNVQDILSSDQDQQCTDQSTQGKGDDPLSHVLSDIPLLSGNGTANH